MNLLPMNAGRVSGRETRRRLNAEAAFVQGQLAPLVKSLAHNDGVSQGRILKLEARLDAFNTLTAWQRLKFLFTGVI